MTVRELIEKLQGLIESDAAIAATEVYFDGDPFDGVYLSRGYGDAIVVALEREERS